jgi:putative hydrolase of the HAD superfamily
LCGRDNDGLQLICISLGGHNEARFDGGIVLRAAVFDLDHTLFDPRTVSHALFNEVECYVRQVATGLLPEAVLDAAFADAWRLPFDRVVTLHQLPDVVTTAGRDAACSLEVTEPLTPFADVVGGLEQLSLRRFLLTTGFRRLQESKLRQLGLTSLFEAVFVDALDPPGPCGKRVLLERLLIERALSGSEVMVVGDRADDELSAGRALGMFAVQVLRPGVVPAPDIQWQIPDLAALPDLIMRLTSVGAA